MAGSESKLIESVYQLNRTSTAYGMIISADKTKVMTNNPNDIVAGILVNGHILEEVHSFKYFGIIISDKGTMLEVFARIAQMTIALSKLRSIWCDRKLNSYSHVVSD